jgi:hypothetical protein
MPKDNIIIGSKNGDGGNILIGTIYGGVIPTTTTTTTTSTTTSTTTTTTTLAYKEINLYQTYYNGGDGTYGSCKNFCLRSCPIMSAGECYCVCLCVPLGMPLSLYNSGSFAKVCVNCNGICKFCACICNIGCVLASTSFVVCCGDCVDIYNEACTTALGCGNVDSCACIFSTTSIVGSFIPNATCRQSLAYTG